MFCKNCGTPNNEGAKFCSGCGGALMPVENEPITAAFEAQEETIAPKEPPVVNYVEPVGQATPIYAEPAVAQTSQPQPPKKKKTGLIVGIIVGVLVIIGAIIAILFATGIFDKDTKEEETTEQTTAKKEETSEEKKEENKEEVNNEKDTEYTITTDVKDEDGNIVEEDKEITFEIPYEYIQGYDAFYDAIEFEIGGVTFAADPECIVIDGNYIIELFLMGDDQADLYVQASYSSENMSAENINAIYVEVNIQKNDSEIMVEYGVDHNGNGIATIFIDEEPYAGALSTGHKIADGRFFDPQGNEIEEDVYAELYDNTAEEIISYLYF